MKTNVRLGLRVLRGIPEYLGREIEGPAAVGPLSTHISTLNAVIDRLDTLVGAQEESDRAVRGATQEVQKVARKLRREFARPVARMGKLLFPTDTTLSAELTLPSGYISLQKLIAIAMGIAARVEEHKAKFVEAGFAEDFVDKMRATCEALNKALEVKAAHQARRAGATSGLNIEYLRGREMVRMIDDMVVPLLEGTQRLAAWKAVSRFVRTTKREVTDGQSEGTGTTSATPVISTPAPKPDNPSPDHHAA